MGLLQTLTNIFANIAYSKNVGITALIMAVPISMLSVIVLSKFNPGLLEKHTTKVYTIRILAALVMIYCAIQITR